MFVRGLALTLWVLFVHSVGIYLFLRGFFLTRLSLSQTTTCSLFSGPCTLQATHKRAIVIIIDALRFDFISPDPPQPPSPFHHSILTLPGELTAKHPDRSFIFNAYADPPTTTLQRIKGLTTGSLPTFMEIGSNFGGSEIAEDSIMKQLGIAGKKIAFMGDDTWLTVFPDSFHPNMTFPFDSFNVEDLHTVDAGVITHLLPLLSSPSESWDFLLAHFLGVDHVGHRLGPDHPTMRAKLQQMDDVLRRVVDLMDEDTLLVLLGDHGMDRTGDHGGDGYFETSSGVWIYSKGLPLALQTQDIPENLSPKSYYPGSNVLHRSIQQIDLLPSLSLLLGLPIPFNNLGTVIPELFSRVSLSSLPSSRSYFSRQADVRTESFLSQALHINAHQVHDYLQAYRSSASSAELENIWSDLESAWSKVSTTEGHSQLDGIQQYTRLVLKACRALWTQFDIILMIFGLTLILAGIVSTSVVYFSLRNIGDKWEAWLFERLLHAVRGAAVGAVLGLGTSLYLYDHPLMHDIDELDCVLFGASFFSAFTLSIVSSPSLPSISLSGLFTIIPLLLHTLSFPSNSFTFWEDRIVPFLLITSIAPNILTGLSAPTAQLRTRILLFTGLFAVCVRAIAMSTVCREEQGAACHVTFFTGSSSPSPPVLVLVLAGPAALGTPWLVRRFLRHSKSDNGLAELFFPFLFTPSLALGTVHWVIEYVDSANLLGEEWSRLLRLTRTAVAWCALSIGLFAAGALWWALPVCLRISTEDVSTPEGQKKKQVTILGFGNAYGAPYLLFWCTALSTTWLATQLTGQLVISLGAVAVLAHLEVTDSMRDAQNINTVFASATPSVLLAAGTGAPASTWSTVQFREVVPLALLGMLTFFGTGHEATVPSIQWKTAFVLSKGVIYPWSPFTVILNSFGPIFLFALAVPLLGLWNMSPLGPSPAGSGDSAASTNTPQARHVALQSLRAGLAVTLYYSVLLFGVLGSAGALRRHLMVWKVWAPRVGLAVGAWGVVEVAVVLGFGVGVARVCGSKGVAKVIANVM